MARKQFLLRIDPELWKQLEKWAADDLRSVNAQVEWLLREAARTRRGSRARQDRPDRDDTEEPEGDGHLADRHLGDRYAGDRHEDGRHAGTRRSASAAR
jgi:hypothetical protein